MCWTALCCTDLRRRGGVGGPASRCPRRRSIGPEAAVSSSRSRWRSQMCVLRRFQVSDEFSAYWQTLDFDSNRMNFFEFSSSHFSRKWKLFGQSMEMSGMTLRIDWKCSRVSTGPASGRNPLVKCGLDTSAPFFRVSGNLKNGRCPKKC